MVWAFIASFFAGSVGSTAVPPTGFVFDIPMYFVVFLGIFSLTFFLMTRPFIRYMQKLSQGLDILSSGDLRHRIPIERKDELGDVATQINAMAEKLETLIEKERGIEKSKMELITGVSHDLRTPLTSILGYIELLKNKGYRDEAEYERFLGNTHSKAIQLKTLIDELFEYTRLSLSETKLETETIDVREMLVQMLAEAEPLARDERIVLEAKLPGSSLSVRADPEKLRRAVDNLLTNALKFSVKPGTVVVSLEAGGGKAAITVDNRGKPMAKEQADRLFDRFYKADESRSDPDRYGGAGLGLAIARNIAELHGGRAYLDYEDARFRFSIELPCEAAI